MSWARLARASGSHAPRGCLRASQLGFLYHIDDVSRDEPFTAPVTLESRDLEMGKRLPKALRDSKQTTGVSVWVHDLGYGTTIEQWLF